MSADNYYAVKFNPNDLKFYVVHGFMSALEEGYPAIAHPDAEGHDTFDDALAEASRLAYDGYGAEYGIVEEPENLRTVVTVQQSIDHANDEIAKWTDWLEWRKETED